MFSCSMVQFLIYQATLTADYILMKRRKKKYMGVLNLIMLCKNIFIYFVSAIYRLDRLTSGLLIFGKNHAATRRLMDQIQARQVSKTYLCRTVGKFPEWVTCHWTIFTIKRILAIVLRDWIGLFMEEKYSFSVI